MLLLVLLIQVMLEATVVTLMLLLVQATKKPKRSHLAPSFLLQKKRGM
jgi:hypothetical protein